MSVYSRALDSALALSASAHKDQLRKGSQVPYIIHPVHVGIILLKSGFPEEVVIAGLLHDVVEDTAVSMSDIEAQFGGEVARLIAAVTERKVEEAGGAERPWRVRKQEQLAHLSEADGKEAALKAADALHNCQSTLADLDAHGPSVWERFKAGPAEQVWYYGSIAALCRQRLSGHPLCDELDASVQRLSQWSEPARNPAP